MNTRPSASPTSNTVATCGWSNVDAAGLVDEALARRLVTGQLARQELERDDPVEAGVAGTVDGAHSAAADAVQDLVVGDRRAGKLLIHASRSGHGSGTAPGPGW
jgi:hypothetical protein